MSPHGTGKQALKEGTCAPPALSPAKSRTLCSCFLQLERDRKGTGALSPCPHACISQGQWGGGSPPSCTCSLANREPRFGEVQEDKGYCLPFLSPAKPGTLCSCSLQLEWVTSGSGAPPMLGSNGDSSSGECPPPSCVPTNLGVTAATSSWAGFPSSAGFRSDGGRREVLLYSWICLRLKPSTLFHF